MRRDVTIGIEVEGADEAKEKVQAIADALNDVPPQVVIRDCKYCTFNIYPTQTKFVSYREEDEE